MAESRTSSQQDIRYDDKEYRGRDNGDFKDCCKTFTKFIFSQIGLCGMVILYSAAGGFIFQHLEQTNEKQLCLEAESAYWPMEKTTVEELWSMSKAFYNRYSSDGKDPEVQAQALDDFRATLVQFRDDTLELGYDGQNCSKMGEADGPGYQWSFPGALLFSVTVITTIGYGNIAPKTFWGRLVCIAYATLGIPLMLLCLANIGDVMADIFRFVYSKVCCCGCCRRKDKNKVESLKPDGEARASTPEAWKNDYSDQKQGLPPSNKQPVIIDDDEDDDDDDDEPISVPLTITMGVIASFIFSGALVFSMWEDWAALDSSYFCFVTISTIGFGDLVPGSANFENTEDKYKMIFSAVYMMFGMAILSMCFSLIQEEIVAKFKWVGEKIGIIEKDKDPDEADDDLDMPDPKPAK